MTAWDTTPDDVERFAAGVARDTCRAQLTARSPGRIVPDVVVTVRRRRLMG